jgi:hypothetical protein
MIGALEILNRQADYLDPLNAKGRKRIAHGNTPEEKI